MGAKVALVDQYGAFLSVKQGRFVLKVKNEVKWEAAPVELESIIVTVEGASLSAAAISLAAQFGIDLVFLRGTKPMARLLPYRYGTTMRRWLLQAQREAKGALDLARSFLKGKLHNQRMVLLEYARRARASGKPSGLLEDKAQEVLARLNELEACKDAEALLVVESHAARAYWEGIRHVLPEELGFEHRYTRANPPPGPLDPFNKALNVGYALLRKEVWRAIFLAGLNPYLGFLHRPRGGRPALVLDLMEEFRPISTDRPLVGLARTKPELIMKLDHEEGSSRELWTYLIKYMKESSPPHIELIETQARKLVLDLQGLEKYSPYLSRW